MLKVSLAYSFLLFLAILPHANSSAVYKVDRKSFSQGSGSKHISDETVIVMINRFCRAGDSLLTDKIFPVLKKNHFSKEESHKVNLQFAVTVEELEMIAQSDDCVLSVSKDIKVELYEMPNDAKLSKQTHLAAIQFKNTYDFFYKVASPKNAVIAIIDNGVDIKHEDLKDSLWVNTKEKNGFPGIDDDKNGLIDDIHGYDFAEKMGDPNHKNPSTTPINSHGTHVAALAAATSNNSVGVSGVMAKNTKIMALNVFGKNAFASFATVDTAIRYAADMGANVINLSLGGKGVSSSTEKAIRYAVSKSVAVVVAAGNNGEVLTDTNFYSPGSYGASIDGMITVGATDTGNKFGELCSFSNRSTKYVELGAPGCHVVPGNSGLLSAFKNNQYGYMAGTSMASPVAAGVALLVFSYLRDQNVKLKPAKIEEFLKSGSRDSSLLESDIQDGKIVDLQSLKDKIISDDN